jgi:hypothetical protein
MATENPGTAAAARRLNSWKEIGAFFGKDERTVKRWEVQRGLPVHRLPGGRRTTVYAFADELDHWLKRSRTAGEAPAAEPAPASGHSLPASLPTRLRGWPSIALAGGALLVALAAGIAAWPILQPTPVVPLSPPAATVSSAGVPRGR